VQVPGCRVSRRGLCRVLLGLAQFGHGGGEGGQVGDERDRGERAVAGDVVGQRYQPGGGA